jgi:acetolactate synthase-1/2/3 large subunit
MTQMTGSRLFAEMLESYGVSHVFYIPAIMLGGVAEMENMPIRRIMTHGEKSAAYMADGYARASRKPGICMAQQIGGSNLAAGLRDAYMAGSPVVALSGGPPVHAQYRNGYQEVQDLSQFDAVTKSNVRVDEVSRLPDLLRQAFRNATTGAPGPGAPAGTRPAWQFVLCQGRSRLRAGTALRPGSTLSAVSRRPIHEGCARTVAES